MRKVERLRRAVAIAQTRGFSVRYEWLGGGSGGDCAYGGKKWLFIDLSLGVADQLDQVTRALEPDVAGVGRNASPSEPAADRRAA